MLMSSFKAFKGEFILEKKKKPKPPNNNYETHLR